MCNSPRWITNKYLALTHFDSRAKLFVSCGHCIECQQEKANARAKRIEFEFQRKDTQCLLVTLTYENRYIPYFSKVDADNFFTHNIIPALPIRRDVERTIVYRPHYPFFPDKRYKDQKSAPLVRSRKPDRVDFLWSPDKKVGLIDTFNFDLLDAKETMSYLYAYNLHPNNFNGLNFWYRGKIIATDTEKIPILYYRDVQNFFKKLRKNLQKRAIPSNVLDLRYFVSGELGETYQRPHWHLLIFFRPQFEQMLRECIYKSWSFCDLERQKRSVETAYNPAAYVASYVNCSSAIPPFFTLAKKFKPSWHYSKVFGFDSKYFSYEKICEQIKSGTCRYDTAVYRKGSVSSFSVPIPKYVLNRYFPRFRGFSWLNVRELCELLFAVHREDTKGFKRIIDSSNIPLSFDLADIYTLFNRIHSRIEKFGNNLMEYIKLYSKVWTIRASECLRLLHDSTDILYCYDNIKNSVFGTNEIKHSILEELSEQGYRPCSLVPSAFPQYVNRANYLSDTYLFRMKQRKVISHAYNK